MANPVADFPAAIHTPTDISTYASTKLGLSFLSHVDVHGKLESEIVAIQEKLGYGSSDVADADVGAKLRVRSSGQTLWDVDYVSVKDFGAVGDGVTDDTAAVQAACDAATGVIFPEGDYCISHVDIDAENKHIIGFGKVKIIQTQLAYNIGAINFRGEFTDEKVINTITAPYPLTLQESGESSPGASRVAQLNLATSMTVSRGDILKVVCNSTLMGEYAVAAYDTTGTDVNLSGFLAYNMFPELAYGTGLRVAKLSNYRLVIENIDFDLSTTLQAGTTSGWFCALSIRAGNGCVVRNCSFSNMHGRGIHNYSYRTSILDCRFKNLRNRPSKSWYGYGIEDGGGGTIVDGCSGENCRHVYTTNNEGTIVADSDLFEYFGSAINCVVSNSIGYGCQSAAFDTHSYSIGVSFNSCKAENSYLGASSGGQGFASRGAFVTFDNCEALNCMSGFNVGTHHGTFIRNCRAVGIRTYGISFGVDSPVAATWGYLKNVRIDNCYFEGKDDPTINYQGHIGHFGGTYPTTDVIISNCSWKSFLSGAGSRVLEIYNAEVIFRNCYFDMSGNTDVSCGALYFSDNTSEVTVDGMVVDGKATSFTANNLQAFIGTGTVTSKIRGKNILIKQDAANAVRLSDTHFSDLKATYQLEYSTTIKTSEYITLVAAAAAVIDISQRASQLIFVELTGTAGAVALADIASGYVQGQIIHIYNGNNNTVTMSSPALSMAAGASSRIGWNGSAWKVL